MRDVAERSALSSSKLRPRCTSTRPLAYGRWRDSAGSGNGAFASGDVASTLPWFPLFAIDWLAVRMSPEQKGALMDLRCQAWLSDPPCTLPDDDEQLAVISGLGDRWVTAGRPIRSLLTPCADGRLLDRWLLELYERQTGRRKAAQVAGRASGNSRRTNFERPGNERATNSQRKSNVGPTSLSNLLTLQNRVQSTEEGNGTPNVERTKVERNGNESSTDIEF